MKIIKYTSTRLLFFCLLFITLWGSASAQELLCLQKKNFPGFIEGRWEGTFTQYCCGVYESYPIAFEITKAKGYKVKGHFIFEDSNAKTSLKGKFKDGRLHISEDKLIEGGEEMLVGGLHEITIVDCETLRGMWRLKNLKVCKDPKALQNGGRYRVRKVTNLPKNVFYL